MRLAERTKYSAPGLAGGRGDVRINGKRVDNRKQYVLERGDRVLLSTPAEAATVRHGRVTGARVEHNRALGYVAGRARTPKRRAKER